jgi:AcrR family transcriptional regulator
VDALLEATARVLEGQPELSETSTNAIATRAGVSVGSLYQYFPDKEALAAALIERKVERDLEEVAGALGPLLGGEPLPPLEAVVRAAVDAMVALHRRDQRLLRALLPLVSRVGRFQQVREAVAGGRTLLRTLLEAHRGALRDVEPELAAFLASRALEELLHVAVLERPALLEDPRFPGELCHLVLAYLRPAAR